MSTLYIDRKNTRMTVSGNTLIFYENGERASTLPLHIIDRICIKGDLALSAADLGKLGEHNIGVLILSGREQQPTIYLPCARKDALRRLAQAHFSQDNTFCTRQAQSWITEKIQREQELLRELQTRPHRGGHQLHENLEQLEKSRLRLQNPINDLATLRGIEGSAASSTFAAIACVLPESLHFTKRNRNPPRDPYNVGSPWATPCCTTPWCDKSTSPDWIPASATTTASNTAANPSPATSSKPCAHSSPLGPSKPSTTASCAPKTSPCKMKPAKWAKPPVPATTPPSKTPSKTGKAKCAHAA